MALPASPPISMTDIVAEYGGSGNHSLSEYYRGGAFVPDNVNTASIPTSGSISFDDFLGTAALGETILLTGTAGSPNMQTTVIANPGTTRSWIFQSDGGIDPTSSGASWVDNPPPEGNYWIRATLLSGNAPNSGTLNSWLALSSTRVWTWVFGGSHVEGVIKVEIATDSGGTNIVDTGYYGASLDDTG